MEQSKQELLKAARDSLISQVADQLFEDVGLWFRDNAPELLLATSPEAVRDFIGKDAISAKIATEIEKSYNNPDKKAAASELFEGIRAYAFEIGQKVKDAVGEFVTQ